MTTTTILYHQFAVGVDCPDGIAAAWVAMQKYPEAIMIGVRHGEPAPDLPEGCDRLIIVDFSYPLEILQQWIDRGIEVTTIDHHKNSPLLKQLGDTKLESLVFDSEECGATLTWKTFFPEEPLPAWLEFVRERDLWRKGPHTDIIHEATAFMGRKPHNLDLYFSLSREDLITLFTPIGQRLLDQKAQQCADLAATAIDFCDRTKILTMPLDRIRLLSDTCNAVIAADPEVDVAITLVANGDRTNVELRSRRGTVNVGAIALALGGGGHDDAAGIKGVNWDSVSAPLKAAIAGYCDRRSMVEAIRSSLSIAESPSQLDLIALIQRILCLRLSAIAAIAVFWPLPADSRSHRRSGCGSLPMT